MVNQFYRTCKEIGGVIMSFKKTAAIAFAIAIFSGGFASAAEKEEWSVAGEVEMRATSIEKKDGQLAKFNEYRDIQNGFKLVTESPSKTYYINILGQNAGRDNEKFNLIIGDYGVFDLNLQYNETPHNFYYGAKTLYGGAGTGELRIPDSLQSALQTSAYGSTSSSTALTTTTGATSALVLNNLAAAQSIDLGLSRNTTSANLKYNFSDSISAGVNYSRELRQGTRAFGGYFTFGQFREIPEPIDYITTMIGANVGWKTEDYKLLLQYNTSKFENNISALIFDNPYAVNDSTTLASKGRIALYPDNDASNYSFSGAANLPLKSRLTAYWSKGTMKQNDSFLPATINPALTVLNRTSGGTTEPNITRNGSIVSGLDGNVDTENRNIRLNIKPIEILDLNAGYRYYNYSNKTPMIDWYRYNTGDRATVGTGTATTSWRRNLPLSFEYTTYTGDAALEILSGLNAKLGYDSTDQKRHNREIEDTKETSYTGSVDYRPAGEMSWIYLKGSYVNAQRRGSKYQDVTEEEGYGVGASASSVTAGIATTGQLPMLQKYDIGDRDRNRMEFLAMIDPVDNLTITGSYISGKDDYKVMDRHIPTSSTTDNTSPWTAYDEQVATDPGAINSLYGLTNDEHSIMGINLDYIITENIKSALYYTKESYKYVQKARQGGAGTGGGTNGGTTVSGSQPSTADWTGNGEDNIDTYGIGFNGRLSSKIGFDVGYTKVNAISKMSLSVPSNASSNGNPATVPASGTAGTIGTSASGTIAAGGRAGSGSNDLNTSWLPDVENTQDTLNLTVDYAFASNFSLGLNYLYEKYNVKDWALDNVDASGYSPGGNPLTNGTAGNWTLAARNNSYDVYAIAVVMKYSF